MVKRSNPAFDLRLRSAVEQLGRMCAVIEVSVIRAERTAHTSGAAVARVAAHDHHRVETMRSRVKRDAMRLARRASRTGDLRVVLTLVRQADALSRLSSWVPELVAVGRDAATVDDRDFGRRTSEMNHAVALGGIPSPPDPAR
ncbi:hypothetical protein [Mycolicibacterium arenosum]|uniref:CHAD domain-containing protein n=1 Tax=Mycolicibacterium arenosum TaxID=2952157 RepID=A0ABT1MBH4_9MYCO|nr:hypothetical protein [Mycolicibacterium sp. CAU 1645]MCP9276501.1 hypothetical protein [Mycolicibacterium sp. CAU 1645]